MRRFLRPDDGVTLIEMSIAMVVASIVLAAAITWVVAALNTDARNRDAGETIDELRFAKSQMVKDLRFAAELIPASSGDDSVSFWLDNGDEVKQAGEIVTYEILGDRTLSRRTDDSSEPARHIAEGLVADESSFVVSGSTVAITLSIDLDTTDDFPSRQLQTSVSARNT